MTTIKEHFKLLGYRVRDVVTGYEGVAESLSFDLYGCVQYAVRPPISKDKPHEFADGRWFDVKRLVPVGDAPIMDVPTFEDEIGGCDKPVAISRIPSFR